MPFGTPKLHAAKVHPIPSGITANGVVPVIQLPPELLLLAQMCTKLFVDWGFAPDPTGVAYSAPRPSSWFRWWAPGKGKKGGERVPECHNPELTSLD